MPRSHNLVLHKIENNAVFDVWAWNTSQVSLTRKGVPVQIRVAAFYLSPSDIKTLVKAKRILKKRRITGVICTNSSMDTGL